MLFGRAVAGGGRPLFDVGRNSLLKPNSSYDHLAMDALRTARISSMCRNRKEGNRERNKMRTNL